MHWDNIGSRWVIPGQNLIDMNLEERQYCRQIYHFLNIDKENKLGGKHAVLFKSLLSLLGEPTWSQSLAEIHRIFTSLKTNIFLGKNALLSSRFVCEILTHQEMAPSWVSTHKNMHAKDKPAQPICPPPPQPAAFPSDLLRPSPKYRGTSGFPVSLTSNTFLKKKKSCTLLDRMPQCKEYSPSIFKPPFAKHLELGFVLFCFLITPPHNLKLLHVLIIQFQNTKLLLHRVLMKRPTQLDNHRFCHERAARCPPPFFAAWAATRVWNPCTLLSF